MRAVRGLIVKYRPDLYVDIHVTDGMDYQYDVTYGWATARTARLPARPPPAPG
jgi:hypothetical protein